MVIKGILNLINTPFSEKAGFFEYKMTLKTLMGFIEGDFGGW